MSKFIIYGLVDPRDGAIRYIGQSTRGLSRARYYTIAREGTRKRNWALKLRRLGLAPIPIVLKELDSAELLDNEEMRIIALYVKRGANLVNMTSGGHGNRGYHLSPSARARIGEANRRRPPLSAEARQRRSEAQRRTFALPEVKERLRKRKRPVMTDKVRETIRCKARLRQADDAIRAHMSQVNGGRPIKDNFGNVYLTSCEAARVLGLSFSEVSRVLRGVRNLKSVKGYSFEYA